MNDCFLNLLFSFQLLLPLKDGADFVGSKQIIDVILSDLSLLGYVIPVGGDLVLDYLFAYLPILRQSIMSGFNLMKNIRLQ